MIRTTEEDCLMRGRLSFEFVILVVVILVCGTTLYGAEGPWLPGGLEGHNVWAIEVTPSGRILAGTAELDPKTMYLSTDFGLTWAEVTGLPGGTEVWDIEIDPTDESIVYAGLNGPGVWKSLDGGASWSWSNLNGQVSKVKVSPSHPGVLYVASQTGGVYKSTDAGGTWTWLTSDVVTHATAVAVHTTDPDVVLAGTPFAGVFKSLDGGVTWSQVNTGFGFIPGVASLFIDPQDPAIVYAGEAWSGVWKSLDGGDTWFHTFSPLWATVGAIEALDGDLYIIDVFEAYDVPAYRSPDGGVTWEPLPRLPDLPGKFWPRSLAVVPGVVLIGTTVDQNPGGIFLWPMVDADSDGDSVLDHVDNCPDTPNRWQVDADGDTLGDLCDECPGDPTQMCNPEGSTAGEIPADAGGVLETPDGAVALVIDPGDLGEDSTLSITEVAPTDPTADLVLDDGNGSGEPLATYLFEPDGLAFNGTVTLTVIADVSALNRGQRRQLDLYLYSDTDGDGLEDSYVSLGATCPVLEGPVGTFIATCTAQLAHLSIYALIAPLDTDGDEVPDQFGSVADLCSETVIPEGVPLDYLQVNRFALMDADGMFDTTQAPGGGRSVTYSTDDTGGCSCEQIIEVLGLGIGHRRFGCSNSVMQQWIAILP